MEENDSSLSVTALIVVLALVFAFYFTVRAVVAELPLLVQNALAAVPSISEQAANPLSMLR